jgi:galactonate dehydratase
MRITDVNTMLINSPSRKWTIVQVLTDEGLIGLGEATYSNKEPVVVEAIRHMKAELIGEDPSRIEFLWHKIYRRSSMGGIWRMAGPVWMSALSGIDQALWDIKGKVAGLPVVDLLGGRFREKVEVYTHFSGNSVEESVASARHIVDKGYTAIKGSVLSSNGYSFDQYFDDGRPKQTAAHFAAVREAVGPDVKLLIDCHGRFTVANCIRLARELEHYNLYAFEDPVPPEDLSAYSKVRREISIPVMGSERLNTKSHFRQLLELDGVDIAQPDLMYAGGITEVKKIAAISDTYHVPISLHNTKGPVGIAAAVHLMASIPNVAPMELVTDIPWRDDIINRPLKIVDGYIFIPEGPGWGIELNMEAVSEYVWAPGDPR